MDLRIKPCHGLVGTIRVPGDKSISHRAAILGSLATGQTKVDGFLQSADCLSTLACLDLLGVKFSWDADVLLINGRGLGGLSEPTEVLDAGNSGTTMRLLAGVAAGFDFLTILTGDASLRKRPMDRVAKPLREMGAKVDGRGDGRFPPLAIRGGSLKPISYHTPVPSAQVKSAILLASLYTSGVGKVAEPWLSRDHTERMMSYFGIPIARRDGWIVIGPVTEQPRGREITIPGDLSSAAFPIAVAACSPGSILRVENVGVNPTRTGLLDVLRAMGARIALENEREVCGEPVADVVVEGTELQGATVAGEIIPRLIDEIPILAVVAAKAKGATVVRDARELRVKETDRLQELGGALSRLGVVVETRDDGLVIEGPQEIKGGVVSSCGDHRLALAMACAGLLAKQEVIVKDFACADISFPGFVAVLMDLGVQVDVA